MNIRDQLIKAISLYRVGQYDIKTFCDVFGQLYYYQNGGYKAFSDAERKYLDKIGFISERYTDSEDDLTQYPNTYYSESQAKTMIDDILISFETSEVSAGGSLDRKVQTESWVGQSGHTEKVVHT